MLQPTPDALDLNAETTVFRLSEIFYSIQGEGARAGLPCVFVRLQGCKLRCKWCDTPYALDGRKPELELTGAEILEKVAKFGCNFVEFTGGEPLEQFGVFDLMRRLCDAGYNVAVETGGHIDCSLLDARVTRIIDVKCPDSAMASLNYWANLEAIRPTDEIKFVVASHNDFLWAMEVVRRYDLVENAAATLISPAFGLVAPQELASWVLAERLPVRLQLQLHKFIWDPAARGV